MSEVENPNGAQNLGADVFIRDPECDRITGMSRATRYAMIAEGKFPKPVKISERIAAWSLREVAEWQRKRIAERDAEKPAVTAERRARFTEMAKASVRKRKAAREGEAA
jgi:prophage regulatory protein